MDPMQLQEHEQRLIARHIETATVSRLIVHTTSGAITALRQADVAPHEPICLTCALSTGSGARVWHGRRWWRWQGRWRWVATVIADVACAHRRSPQLGARESFQQPYATRLLRVTTECRTRDRWGRRRGWERARARFREAREFAQCRVAEQGPL